MLDTTITATTLAEPFAAPMLAPPMTLPEAINAAHDAAKGAGKTMLLKAKEAGDLLLQAKAECAHGAFKAWVEENCAFSYPTAHRYMQVAKKYSSVGKNLTDEIYGGTVAAFLDHLTAGMPPAEDADTPALAAAEEEAVPAPATPPKAKPSTAKVSELKAEITRLAEAVERLSGELQDARGRETALRDALATAEAHIKTLQHAPGGPVVSLEDACGLAGDPPAPVLITAEELATLRRDIRDYEEMYDDAQAGRDALKKEVAELKRQLHKAVSASPKAAQALRPAALDEDGFDTNDARNW
ncbi:DUF3102 domain-containing protein [Xanthobacter sp. V0B-10]|uniref:DUF3102 domain-containing protein n=1 Tax=Xanthobacter albus TaxID=3119929 RepID=UPI00372761C7